MSKERIEFILDHASSRFLKRRILEDEIIIDEAIVSDLGSQIIRSSKGVFRLPENVYMDYGPVNMAISNEGVYYTVPILKLPLKTHYSMNGDVMCPMFSGKDEPIMPMSWSPPPSMKLVLVVLVKHYEGVRRIDNQWLFAFNESKQAFRLPLGNSFPDGRLCSGEFERIRPTDYECIQAELDQLIAGQWQGDLDKNPNETKSMFRFKPMNDKFEQQPPTQEWSTLCQKIAPSILKFAVI